MSVCGEYRVAKSTGVGQSERRAFGKGSSAVPGPPGTCLGQGQCDEGRGGGRGELTAETRRNSKSQLSRQQGKPKQEPSYGTW
jgi:hypothetical protein